MKDLIIVTRLFSGLIDSIVDQEWKPKGIPAIYKLIEGCNEHGLDVDTVFLCKKLDESSEINRIKKFFIKNTLVNKIQFHVVPFKQILSNRILNRYINSIIGYCYVFKLYKINRYKLLYCDRVNVVLGFLVIKILRRNVILRLLGFYPDMKQLFDNPKQKYRNPLLYYSYKSKFSKIICTQDDSGGSYYLKRYFNHSPNYLLINGIKQKATSLKKQKLIKQGLNLEQEWPIILFVGKLEIPKGCYEFVQLCKNLHLSGINFYGLILGDGSKYHKINEYIKINSLEEKVKLLGPVDNAKIHHFYNISDIYVHLYLWASLTNTMLEAISAGNAIVSIDKSNYGHVGTYLDKISLQYVKIDRNNLKASLNLKMNHILTNSDQLKHFKDSSNQYSCKLTSWDDRIRNEIYLFQSYF